MLDHIFEAIGRDCGREEMKGLEGEILRTEEKISSYETYLEYPSNSWWYFLQISGNERANKIGTLSGHDRLVE